MTILHTLYILLGSGLAMVALPLMGLFWKNDRKRQAELAQRLGVETEGQGTTGQGRPLIWLHAVSVGEVKAAEIVINALDRLLPRCSLVVTATTRTGRQYALERLSQRAVVRYAPLDLWESTGRFLSAHRPDLLVCMETEIWPNWFVRAHRMGIKTAICNGRISSRSIRAYLKIRPLLKPVLATIDAFSMISEKDALRIRQLGAPADRVYVHGNVKQDALPSRNGKRECEKLRQVYALKRDTPVLVAGSVRGEEGTWLVDVFNRLSKCLPNLVFIVAPRHIEKSTGIAAAATASGVRWQYRTQMGGIGRQRHAPLVILDTIGELRQVYGLARVVFCGGSLIPLGGQNLLEAAVQAKPILYGPFMEDFREERDLIEAAGGGICVRSAAELADRALYLLSNPEKAHHMGQLARQAVFAGRGAAMRHARVLHGLLNEG